jgi:hypothetical protein
MKAQETHFGTFPEELGHFRGIEERWIVRRRVLQRTR